MTPPPLVDSENASKIFQEQWRDLKVLRGIILKSLKSIWHFLMAFRPQGHQKWWELRLKKWNSFIVVVRIGAIAFMVSSDGLGQQEVGG